MVKRKNELLLQTRELYEAMYRFDVVAARKLGISLSDLRCVNALENGPLSPGELGRRLSLTSGSVSSMLDRLERKHFIKRRVDQSDQRRVFVKLEESFYQKASEIYEELGRALREEFDAVTADEVQFAAKHISGLAEGFNSAAERI